MNQNFRNELKYIKDIQFYEVHWKKIFEDLVLTLFRIYEYYSIWQKKYSIKSSYLHEV